MIISIDHEKYGDHTIFNNLEDAEKSLNDCGFNVILEIQEDGDIKDETGDIVGRFYEDEDLVPLGYGEYRNIVSKLPQGNWTIIMDEDAAEAFAESCWFVSKSDPADVEAQHQYYGGTVSTTTQERIK